MKVERNLTEKVRAGFIEISEGFKSLWVYVLVLLLDESNDIRLGKVCPLENKG